MGDDSTTPCPACGAARRRPGLARRALGWSLTAATLAGGLLAAATGVRPGRPDLPLPSLLGRTRSIR
jgi:hypothetical protein